MDFVACDYCDAPFEVEQRYPVTVEDGGDEVRIHSFCDDTCQRAWELDRFGSR